MAHKKKVAINLRTKYNLRQSCKSFWIGFWIVYATHQNLSTKIMYDSTLSNQVYTVGYFLFNQYKLLEQCTHISKKQSEICKKSSNKGNDWF